MTYRIAICDDEQRQIEYLTSVVSAWSNESGHKLTIPMQPIIVALLCPLWIAACILGISLL